MSRFHRRQWMRLVASAGCATGLAGIGTRSLGQPVGANDAVRVAVVGLRGRGQSHLASIAKTEGMRLAGLCEVDPAILGQNVEKIRQQATSVLACADVRKLLDSSDVDAVTIATPNHWHSLIGIWAVQAGKDVYIEKPVSHNVWEGRQLVRAARKHGRIVQTGTQARANPDLIEAVRWVRDGNLGTIRHAVGTCFNPRLPIGKVGRGEIPSGLDYDLWTGPAPLEPLARQNLHYDWHWFYDYGNGDLGNQGIHEMDIARWFMGVNELSPRVFSLGGRFSYVDDGETPNTQIVYHDYPGAPLIFEVRGLPEKTGSEAMDKFRGGSIAVIIHCEGGTVVVPNYSKAIAYDKEEKELKQFEGAKDHYANFLAAVRSRKTSDLKADILEGHLSSALCHTGNISYRLGQQASPGEIREQIKGDRDASATFDRMAEHLAANGVDLQTTKASLGPVLKMDPKTETFSDTKANELLTRAYRKPFIVPARV